jgi:hypothetical protein
MKGANSFLRFACVLAVMSTGCGEATGPSGSGPGNQANDRISIVNDAATLAARVTYYDTDVPIETVGVGYPAPRIMAPVAGGTSSASQAGYSMKLKAEVAPPSVAGQVLQATSVALVGDLAVVSYNMIGNPYLGAVDVFEINSGGHPVLQSQAVFQNTDVSAVFTMGQNVFVAEATGDAGFAAPAVFEIMQLQGSKLVLDGNRRTGLTSFVGTGVAASGSRAYATSGDNGGLFAIDPTSLAVLESFELHDARGVAVGGGKVVVVQGTPGQIAVFDESTLAPAGTFGFAGADVPESKSTVDLAGGKAFVAAGPGGVQVLSTSTGKVVGSVPRPDPASLGLDPSVVVTNAAAIDEDLIFISNGEAGVYVAQGSKFFTATGSETQQQITMLGRLGFGKRESVNHVAYRDKYLIVAAGLGGVKIVQVK